MAPHGILNDEVFSWNTPSKVGNLFFVMAPEFGGNWVKIEAGVDR